MAAVNSNALRKATLSVCMAMTPLLLFYYVYTQAAIWNDCQFLQARSSLLSSSISSQLERLRLYFFHTFNVTDSHSNPPRYARWNHHNIANLCDQHFFTISVFVMTTQLLHDLNLFIFLLYDNLSYVFLGISQFLKKTAIHACVELLACESMMSCFCAFVLLILVSSGTYCAILCLRKLNYSEKSFTSYHPYRNDNNLSLALTRSRRLISKSESFCDHGEVCNRQDMGKEISISTMCSLIIRWILLLIAFTIVLSIPWEFIRLYQKAVARRAANVNMGLPKECSPNSLGWMESLKSLLRWHLSWSHDRNPCIEYYHSTLVDPLWEVNPLLVLSSVLSHGVVHPLEVVSASLGRSVRIFFAEIPAHWQHIVMLVAMITLVAFLLVLCSYRISIPLLLRIEPKTPVGSPTEEKYKGSRLTNSKSRRIASRYCGKKRASPDVSFSNSLQTE